MSDEILNDDQLDAVAGGVTNVTFPTKKASTAFATTARDERIIWRASQPAPKTIDRTAGTAALGSIRSRVTR